MQIFMLFIASFISFESVASASLNFSEEAKVVSVRRYASEFYARGDKFPLESQDIEIAAGEAVFVCDQIVSPLNISVSSTSQLVSTITEKYCGPIEGEVERSYLSVGKPGSQTSIKFDRCPTSASTRSLQVVYLVGNDRKEMQLPCKL